MPRASDESGLGTVARVVKLMSALADHPKEVGVNQLAEEIGLAPSTVHRLLNLLREEDIVDWRPDTRSYRVGPGFYRIAARVMGSATVPQLAAPFVRDLAARFNETVLFGLYLPANNGVSFVAREDGQQALQYRIDMDTPLSLVWGASGKVILAQLPDAVVERAWEQEQPSPASASPRPALNDLRTELAVIRTSGVAVSDSEKLPGARGIAAPVFDRTGVVGCLILTSPRERLPHGGIEEISNAMALAARQLSETLGDKRA